MRILVVDDSEAARLILRDMLEGSGHTVVQEEETLQGTLASYAQHKPDLVTLDLSLADCDGFSVLKALLKFDAKAKVLVVSANSQKIVIDQLLQTGAAGYLEKPFRQEDLLAAIACIFPK